MQSQPYFYSHQIERYLIQFANIFTGFKIKVGTNDDKFVSVPIMYGSYDKVVASILGENTQNKPMRLPVMSTHMTGISQAPEMNKGIGQEDRFSYLPSGGMLPDDVKVIHRYMPVPYKITTEVHCWVSNQHQQMQLLEQILMIFDPSLTIQTSDNPFDWTKLTFVELTDISLDEVVPAGGDERSIVIKLSFEFPIWITPPAKNKDDFIKKIFIRLDALGHEDAEYLDRAADSQHIIDFLDGKPLGYIKAIDADDYFSAPPASDETNF
jgi:hypothetical protein